MLLENLPEELQREIRRHLFKFVKRVCYKFPSIFLQLSCVYAFVGKDFVLSLGSNFFGDG